MDVYLVRTSVLPTSNWQISILSIRVPSFHEFSFFHRRRVEGKKVTVNDFVDSNESKRKQPQNSSDAPHWHTDSNATDPWQRVRKTRVHNHFKPKTVAKNACPVAGCKGRNVPTVSVILLGGVALTTTRPWQCFAHIFFRCFTFIFVVITFGV